MLSGEYTTTFSVVLLWWYLLLCCGCCLLLFFVVHCYFRCYLVLLFICSYFVELCVVLLCYYVAVLVIYIFWYFFRLLFCGIRYNHGLFDWCFLSRMHNIDTLLVYIFEMTTALCIYFFSVILLGSHMIYLLFTVLFTFFYRCFGVKCYFCIFSFCYALSPLMKWCYVLLVFFYISLFILSVVV